MALPPTTAGPRPAASNRFGVSLEFPDPADLPCPDCGVSVRPDDAHLHACPPGHFPPRQLFLEDEEHVTLSDEVAAYLASPRGQFEVWYAERQRRRGERR